jgi:frataxin-like iron-binding protein CyaY
MHKNFFIEQVQATWDHWLAHLESVSEIDCEDTGQSLLIKMPDHRVYLFNMHTILQQLWMSSPISGGRHFVVHQKCSDKPSPLHWQDTRNGESIENVLNQEFAAFYQIPLQLSPVILNASPQ